MNRRTLQAILLALFLLPATVWPVAAQSGNLLVNPSFENGFYHHNGIPELAVPNGWDIHYLDGVGFPGVDEGYVARRPETVVWYIQDAPDSERPLFFLDGNYTVKVFKPWAPLYAGLSQVVTGLEVGARYKFIVNIYVDVVDSYSGDKKNPPTNEPEGVMLRTGVSPAGAAWRDESKITYAPWVTAGNTTPFHQSFVKIVQKFTATNANMIVWVDMVSKFAYVNNGFFMDRFELTKIGEGEIIASGTPQTVASSTPTPTASLLPATATPVPPTQTPVPPTVAPVAQTVRYVVQRGDSLGDLARRYGTTVAAIVAANGLSNPNFIFTGQVLQIPGAGAAVPPAQPTSAPQNPPPAPAGGTNSAIYVVQRGDSLGAIARKYGVSIAALVEANGIHNSNIIFVGQVLTIPGVSQTARTYTVVRGDTLAAIAARFGTTVAALQAANNLSNINFIFVGQVLKVP